MTLVRKGQRTVSDSRNYNGHKWKLRQVLLFPETETEINGNQDKL